MTQKEIAIAHELGHMLGRYVWSGNIDNVEYFTISTNGDGYTHSENKILSDYLRTHNHSLQGYINEPDAMNVIVGQLLYGMGGMVMERIYTNDEKAYNTEGAAADLQFAYNLIVTKIGMSADEYNSLQSEILAILETAFSLPSYTEATKRFVKYIGKQCKPNKTNKFKPQIFYSFFPRMEQRRAIDLLQHFRNLWAEQNP